MQDTVEKDVAGLAEQIIVDDERRRAQELVCGLCPNLLPNIIFGLGCFQHCSKTAELGSQT